MKPYILVTGSVDKIDEFEMKVSSAIEEGYALAGELVVQQVSAGTSGNASISLFQSLIFEDGLDDDDLDDLDFEFIDEEGLLAVEDA